MNNTNPPSSPLISVIIPAYNAEQHIEEALHSVFNQTYPNVEIIVVNDGSTDSTLQVLNKYQSKIKVLTQNNLGVARARNYAAEEATGDWLAFIDSDDRWTPDKLTTQFNSLNKEGWSHTNSIYFGFNQDGKTKRSDLSSLSGGLVFNKLIIENFITTSTVLINKELFLSHNGFDESLKALEDWELWIRIARTEPLHYNDEVLGEYRITPGSTSRKTREVLPLHIALINSIFSKEELAGHHKLKKQALSSSYNVHSYIAEDADDYAYSLQCAFSAWRNKKFNLSTLKRVFRCLYNYIKNL